ncbi:MAG: glycerol kinase, partial [Rhodocyclaceae bacterium]
IARAALESIAFQSAELLAAMQADAAGGVRELRVDGGAAANDMLLQFQADLLGINVVRPKTFETTALGAAHLAGLSAGVWSGVEALEAAWQLDRIFEPRISRDAAESRMSLWRKAVSRVGDWEK